MESKAAAASDCVQLYSQNKTFSYSEHALSSLTKPFLISLVNLEFRQSSERNRWLDTNCDFWDFIEMKMT